jgi:hypothetical protein
VTAAALLAELKAVGIDVSRDGDNLKVRGQPGASLALYTEQIRKHKPELLVILSAPQPNPPTLIWMHVLREDVETSKPPADWDRSLPEACGWRSLCQTLGPCPRHLTGGPCRIDGAPS